MTFDHIKHAILFGGGDTLARFALNLIKHGFKVEVITAERRRQDMIEINGTTISLLDFLKANKIPVHFSEDVNTDKVVAEKITPQTMGFSIAAPWVFRKNFIELFKGYLFNHHGAPLPRFRGGGGMSWRILQDYRRGFNLIHQVDTGVDTGSILKMREFSYPLECRVPLDYFKVNIEREEEFLCLFLDDIKNRTPFMPVKQSDDHLSSYWPRLSTEHHGYINWSWSLTEVELFICAFGDPYRGAATMVNQHWVYIKKCFHDYNDGTFHPFQTGLVYRKNQNSLTVATKEGSLIITDVRDEQGHSIMETIRIGDRFFTPMQYLESAMQFRAFYESGGLKKK